MHDHHYFNLLLLLSNKTFQNENKIYYFLNFDGEEYGPHTNIFM